MLLMVRLNGMFSTMVFRNKC